MYLIPLAIANLDFSIQGPIEAVQSKIKRISISKSLILIGKDGIEVGFILDIIVFYKFILQS